MKIRFKDIISPKRWRAYYIYLLRKHLKWMGETDYTPKVHEVEQYMFRFINCSDCMAVGSCKHCGCDMPGRALNTTDHCSAGKWGSFLHKDDWNYYKQNYKIKFKLERNGNQIGEF